jgi:hypothetical protein
MKLLSNATAPDSKLSIEVMWGPDSLPNFMFFVTLSLHNKTDLAFQLQLQSPCKKVDFSLFLEPYKTYHVCKLRYRELAQLANLYVGASDVIGPTCTDSATYQKILSFGFKMYQRYEKAIKIGQKSIFLDLNDLEKLVVQETDNTTTLKQPVLARPIKPIAKEMEIDLHYSKGMGLAKNQILVWQMEQFLQVYNNALRQGVLRLKVNHGIGEGVLKAKIHAFLTTEKANKRISNFGLLLGNEGLTFVDFNLR